MKLEISYYGILGEITGHSQETFDMENPSTHKLKEALLVRYPSLMETTFKMAVGNQIIDEDIVITDNKVALLPPFSGG